VIRDELFKGNREKGLEMTGLTREKPVLLIMGGSTGSERINNTIRASLDKLLLHFHIIHICGQGKADPAQAQAGYVQFEYIHDDLKHIFSISDFVISRAGANAIFEFLALHMPMLLI